METPRYRDPTMEPHGQTYSCSTKMCIADGIQNRLTKVHFLHSTSIGGRERSKVRALSEKFVLMAFWPSMTTTVRISAPQN